MGKIKYTGREQKINTKAEKKGMRIVSAWKGRFQWWNLMLL